MKKWIIALFVLPMLASCYSFNHINIPDEKSGYKVAPGLTSELLDAIVVKDESVSRPTAQRSVAAVNVPNHVAAVIAVTQPVRQDGQDMKSDVLCSPYMMPTLTVTPELPIKELMKVGPNNPEALDRIQSRHIAELREYIAQVKISIRNSHNEYLTECYTSSNGRQQ